MAFEKKPMKLTPEYERAYQEIHTEGIVDGYCREKREKAVREFQSDTVRVLYVGEHFADGCWWPSLSWTGKSPEQAQKAVDRFLAANPDRLAEDHRVVEYRP